VPDTPQLKATFMPEVNSTPAARTEEVYFLFAHEAYHPGPGTEEINTTVVAADTLLHPKVRQPDGARIRNLLTRRRQQGEIVPLATLTHELDGGTGWPYVGDWKQVTDDLVQLVHAGHCDALSLGLPAIARALVCTGPQGHVHTHYEGFHLYGPSDRAAVLASIRTLLDILATERPFWPGDNLLPAFIDHA
jgi:hypothetical protein